IVHVNADDPAACVEVARLAFAYRAKFQKDFLIDLIGYRRYGHNEGDEAGFTQPLLYEKIETHPTVRKKWADRIIREGIIEADKPDQMVQERMDILQKTLENLNPEEVLLEPYSTPPPAGVASRVRTAVSIRRLRQLNKSLWTFPEDFTLHPRMKRLIDRRRRALDDSDTPKIDWALAEILAFASILEDGVPIRFTGEDVERGTFSQRHNVLHDYKTDKWLTPLRDLPQAAAAFETRNSPLSEYAVLGFEYGYNIQAPERLVLWEAQYGDFIDGAQIIIDEFLVSARAKWGQTPSLVLLLPHGFEGQGPDHSSGLLERFLGFAADINMRIANCTTAAQYFHLLRRQARLLKVDPLPLIVMTPKSLLRHPSVASPVRDFAEGAWQPIIEDEEALKAPDQVRRLVFCSGKVFVDMI
ncbi:MAG: thiamine pyrophosphate-dependent enzyme, partial [Candidatus Latescibacteria bacterium]|nr:thiamine pyrophosphate-dependent enzyme [Candidatus Latescibacterota bacterium]